MKLVGGLLDRCPRLQSSSGIQSVVSVIGRCRVDLKRRPQLRGGWVFEVGRQHEVARHDADHLKRLAVQLNRAPDYGGIAAVSARPQAVPDDDEVRPVRDVLRGRERATGRRRNAEDRKQVRSDIPRGNPLGFSVAGDVDLPVAPGTHRRQGLSTSAVVDDFSCRHPGFVERRPLAPDHHRPIGIVPGQRPQQNGVYDAEDGRIGADAERQRQNRDRGKRRIPPHAAGAEAEIGDQSVDQCASHDSGLDGRERPEGCLR